MKLISSIDGKVSTVTKQMISRINWPAPINLQSSVEAKRLKTKTTHRQKSNTCKETTNEFKQKLNDMEASGITEKANKPWD